MGEKSGPQEGIAGVVEGVKGKAKEVIGAVTGRDDVKKEGQAQQDKADAQLEVAKAPLWARQLLDRWLWWRRCALCVALGLSTLVGHGASQDYSTNAHE